VYHVEVRQFPHNTCHFNLGERELLALAVPWVNQEWVEVGERRWNVNQAKLTILEGPHLSGSQLTMGRGWRSAQRRSEDVTERVLGGLRRAAEASAQAAERSVGATGRARGAAPAPREGGSQGARAAQPAAAPGHTAAGDRGLLADSLGLEILALLDDGPVTLDRVWRLAGDRLGRVPASESLALGEQAVRSLLERGLVVLRAQAVGEGAIQDAGPAAQGLPEEQIGSALSAIDSWSDGGQSPVLLIRRA
jgi:hypothetical protein